MRISAIVLAAMFSMMAAEAQAQLRRVEMKTLGMD